MKRKDFIKIIGTSLAFAPLTKLSMGFATEAKNSRKIKILATTDVHGAIFPFDFILDTKAQYSLAQVQTYLKLLRKKGEDFILLDNGDILQGQPTVYFSNFEDLENQHICSKVMNYMKYDAATIGNHDIEAGHKVYDQLVKEFNFPWLAANAIKNADQTPYFEPYTIIERNNIKIAILGQITPGVPKWLPEKIWEGMYFEDMLVSVAEWEQKIIAIEKPDILIGLFHSGTDYTFGNQQIDTPKNENAAQLAAENSKYIDIVIAGHDHQKLNTQVKNQNNEEVILVNPASHARYLAEIDIEIITDDNGEIEQIVDSQIIDVSEFEPDEDFLLEFKNEYWKVKNYVSKEIGKIDKAISARNALFESCAFVDLIHNIQLEITKANISFTAPLSLHAEIAAGKLYVKDMFQLYKFENLLYTMSLSGKEIRNFLEYSYSLWFNTMTSKNDHLLNFMKDENGNLVHPYKLANPFFNFDSAAGIDYTVDITKEVGERIKIEKFSNGTNFSETETYLVAINSYRGNGGGGHLERGAGIANSEINSRIVSTTEKDLRYYLMKWIEEKGEIKPRALNNWEIIPSAYFKTGKYGDIGLIFNR